MIGSVVLGTLAGLACGYQVVKRSQSQFDSSASREKQIINFKEKHQVQTAVTKKAAVSFDLFDTLVARDLPHPHAIFDLVEATSGVSGFAQARRSAEAYCSQDCLGGISDIYEHLGDQPAAALRELEWQAELDHAVLIRSNVDKILAVPEGTAIIIVSDTFYSADKLRELLLHLKMPRLDEITIFASRNGKRDGWVWAILNETYDIERHTGDNIETDVRSPSNSGVVKRTVHSHAAHLPTAGESLMFKFSRAINSAEREMGSMMRRLSMNNPYDSDTEREKFFWYRLHASYTIPLFWFFLRSILDLLRSNSNLTHIAAISRDCILLEPLIERYVLHNIGRTVTMTRVSCSRRVLRGQLTAPNEDFLSYLKESLGGDEMTTKTLVLDINGTYKSLSKLCLTAFGGIPRAHYLSVQTFGPPAFAAHAFSVAIPEIDTNIVERLNLTRNGSMIEWIGKRSDPFGGPVRVPCEYNDSYIDVTERAVLVDSIHVLRLDYPRVMPHTRLMPALLQKASATLGGTLKQVDGQTTFADVSHTGCSPAALRQIDLANYYARVLTRYVGRRTDDPVRLLDVISSWSQGKKPTSLPWREYMNDRISVTAIKTDEFSTLGLVMYDVVVLTASQAVEAKHLATQAWPHVKTYLGVHIMHHAAQENDSWMEELVDGKLVARWPLVHEGLPDGCLIIIEK